MKSETSALAFWLRGALVAACCVICIGLVSCGTGNQSTACSTPTSMASSIQAGDGQNGTSITLHPGQSLTVTLCSTYWTFQGSANTQVLASVGVPAYSPAPKDTCPVAGSGCGTASAEFRAVGIGTTQVTASRVSCGEAMGCTSAAGHFQLTVKVSAASQ